MRRPDVASPATSAPGLPRIRAFDLARGLAVLFMVLVHVLGHYGNDAAWGSPAGQALIFLGGPTAAPVFMFLMGASLAFSRRSTPRAIAARGLWLLGLAYTLNVLRGVLPASLGLATGYVTEAQIAPYTPAALMTLVDIHQMAGLALLVLSGLTWLAAAARVPLAVLGLGVAVVVGLVSPLLWGTMSGRPAVDLGLALLWGADWNVFFPLFPWLVYPLVGFAYGRLAAARSDPRRFVRRVGVLGVAIGLAGLALGSVTQPVVTVEDYWRQGPSVLLSILGLVLTWLALADLVADRLGNARAGRVLYGWSRRVTSMYCIHWILIGWGVGLVGHRLLDLPAVLAAMLVVLVATDRLTVLLPFLRGRRAGATVSAARVRAGA